jgi:hypothetical protein
MKKSIYLSVFSLSVLMFFTSCGPTLTVSTDYDHTANFSHYKTFRIVKLEQQYQALSQFNQTRIINAVTAQMIAKGFKQADDNADLLVNITSILKNQKEVVANSYGYGGGYRPYSWGGGNMSTTVNVQHYVAGSLIIEVASAATKKLLWEGVGNQDIDQPLKNPDKTIPSDIQQIMASFPPGRK